VRAGVSFRNDKFGRQENRGRADVMRAVLCARDAALEIRRGAA
jgi:hypothetical protein